MKNKKKKEKPKSAPQKKTIADFEEEYREKLPQNWEELNETAKLNWIGHRMLLDHREIVRQEDGAKAARDLGFLSEYQLERRRRREVQSKIGSWDDIPARNGIFRRVYVDKNNLVINKEQKNDNGQKN